MQIEKRTMGWIQKPSAYQYNQQMNAKRKAQAQYYLNEQTVLSSAIFTAKDNMSYGMTEIALKAVAQKLQAEAQAKIDSGLAEIDDTRDNLGIEKPATTEETTDSVDKTA